MLCSVLVDKTVCMESRKSLTLGQVTGEARPVGLCPRDPITCRRSSRSERVYRYLCRTESGQRRANSEFMNLGRRYVLFTRKKSVYADSAAITGKPGGSAVIRLIMPELGEYPAGHSRPGAGRRASGAEPRQRDQRSPIPHRSTYARIDPFTHENMLNCVAADDARY